MSVTSSTIDSILDKMHQANLLQASLLNSLRSAVRLATITDLKEMEHRIMSAISDFAAAVQVSLDKVNADLDTITTGIQALDTLIQNLQNSPGTLSAADQAALDAISASSAALAAKADAVVPITAPPVPGA